MTDHHGTDHHGPCQHHGDGTAAAGHSQGEDSPILVEVTRGDIVESVHRGRACIVDAAGHVVAHWGDIDSLIYPRSALKPLQAIALVESGAAQALAVTDAEIALACASHNGEMRHVRAVAAWLQRMGLSVDHLECGPHEPFDAESAADLIRAGDVPTALHNNCSGKHAGFLATAKVKGEPLAGYCRIDHPVQQRVLGILEQMSGQDLTGAPCGVDGCMAPAFTLPLSALAYAMARMANPTELPERRIEAIKRIRTAWAAHSYLIGGRNTFDTAILRVAAGQVLVKKGAEGVGVAVLPKLGLGIAIKIDDGASRARDIALAALIQRTGLLGTEQWRRLVEWQTSPVMTTGGRDAGTIRPAAVLAPGQPLG